MNRPPPLTYLLGNPLVALGVIIGGGVTLYGWWLNQIGGGTALIAAIAMSASLNASNRLRAYKEWKQAWDNLSGEPPTPSLMRSRGGRRVIGLLLASPIFCYAGTHLEDPAMRAALIWLIVVLPAIGVFAWIRRRPKKGQGADPTHSVVSISVQHTLMDTPPLAVAYQRLPAHCMRVLSTPNTRSAVQIKNGSERGS